MSIDNVTSFVIYIMTSVLVKSRHGIIQFVNKLTFDRMLHTIKCLHLLIDKNNNNDIAKKLINEFSQKIILEYYKEMVHENIRKIPNALHFYTMLHMSDVSMSVKNKIDKVLENICEQLLEESTIERANSFFYESIIDEDDWICSLSKEACNFWESYISEAYPDMLIGDNDD